MEHPAFRSGSSTCWCVGGENVGRFGHEVDAAEHDEVGIVGRSRDPRETERVASRVCPPHDLVALVVVAEDDDAGIRVPPSPS